MAILRLERQGWNGEADIYDGIVELADDLDDLTGSGSADYHGSRINPVASGSVMYCLEDGKCYIKQEDGTWEAA